jgi:hypothetical protein
LIDLAKGKVERMIASIKSRFYPEAQRAGFTRLEDLNAFFFAWLSKEYHRREHSALPKMTPLERWRQDADQIQRVSPDEIKRALMLRTTRRVHVRTGLISLESKTFQASPRLAGKIVQVRWHAGTPLDVEIWLDGKCVEIARVVVPAPNIDFARKHKPDITANPPVPLLSSKNYAKNLVSSHQGETEVYPAVSHGYLSQEELLALFRQYLERELSAEEMSCLAEFFMRRNPLIQDIVVGSLAAAVSVKGADRHLRYYLEQIEQRVPRR